MTSVAVHGGSAEQVAARGLSDSGNRVTARKDAPEVLAAGAGRNFWATAMARLWRLGLAGTLRDFIEASLFEFRSVAERALGVAAAPRRWVLGAAPAPRQQEVRP